MFQPVFSARWLTKNRAFVYSIILIFLVLVLDGCSEPPEAELERAKVAYKLAMKAQAPTYAKDRFDRAGRALEKSMAGMKEGDYGAAKEAAILAKKEADAALLISEEKRKSLKVDLERGISDLRIAANRVSGVIEDATGIPDGLKESYRGELGKLEISLSHLALQIGEVDCSKRLEECRIWSSRLAEIEKEIETGQERARIQQEIERKKLLEKRSKKTKRLRSATVKHKKRKKVDHP